MLMPTIWRLVAISLTFTLSSLQSKVPWRHAIPTFVATLGCKAKVTYVIAKGKRKWVAHTNRIHLSISSTERLAISRTGICSNSNGVQELVYEVCGGLRFESTTVRKTPHGLAVCDGTDADMGISMW